MSCIDKLRYYLKVCSFYPDMTHSIHIPYNTFSKQLSEFLSTLPLF